MKATSLSLNGLHCRWKAYLGTSVIASQWHQNSCSFNLFSPNLHDLAQHPSLGCPGTLLAWPGMSRHGGAILAASKGPACWVLRDCLYWACMAKFGGGTPCWSKGRVGEVLPLRRRKWQRSQCDHSLTTTLISHPPVLLWGGGRENQE